MPDSYHPAEVKTIKSWKICAFAAHLAHGLRASVALHCVSQTRTHFPLKSKFLKKLMKKFSPRAAFVRRRNHVGGASCVLSARVKMCCELHPIGGEGFLCALENAVII